MSEKKPPKRVWLALDAGGTPHEVLLAPDERLEWAPAKIAGPYVLAKRRKSR